MSDAENASSRALRPRPFENVAASEALSSLTLWYAVFVAGAVTAIGVYGFVLWSYRGLREAVLRYGWGNVPPQELDIFAFFETWYFILDYGPIVVFGIGFIAAMAHARILAELAGVGLSYRYGWTIATLFIPLVNLVRPWLGFAEIRRAIVGTAATSQPGAESGFSFFTVLLALAVILGSAVQRAVGTEFDRLGAPTTQAGFFAFADQVQTWLLIAATAQTVQLVIMWLYLATIRSRAVILVDRLRAWPEKY